MQHLDYDIDLDLDDPDAELDVHSAWGQLVNIASTALLAPSVTAVYAELTDRSGLLHVSLAVAVLLFVLAGFGLVMEYRADHR